MKNCLAASLMLALVGCGGDSGGDRGDPPGPSAHTIGGSISGLTSAGLVLSNSVFTVQPDAGATSFLFPIGLPIGTSYQVNVKTQPPGLTCTTQGASGTVGTTDVTSVAVSCTPTLYAIGGTVSGLTGTGLVLANGSDVVDVAANATQFTLPAHANGSAYAVVVQTQPAGQRCTVSAGSGTVASQAISDVKVDCGSHSLYVASDTGNAVIMLPLDSSGMPLSMGMTQAVADSLPRRLAMSPDGRHLYADAAGAGVVDMYDIAAGGALNPLAPGSVAAGGGPTGIGVTPDGRFAYVASGNALFMYAVGSDGKLSALSPASIALADSGSITISPDGRWLYAATGTPGGFVAMYAIGADGQLSPLATPLAPTDRGPFDVVLTPDGKFAYASSSIGSIREFKVQADGTLDPLGDVSANLSTPQDIAISPDGKVAYVPDWDNNIVAQYAVGATGLLVPLSPATAAVGDGPVSVAISPDGKKAYVANLRENTVAVFDVNSDGTLNVASRTTTTVTRPYHLLFR